MYNTFKKKMDPVGPGAQSWVCLKSICYILTHRQAPQCVVPAIV